MNLQAVLYFLTVAQTQSFSKAAEQLYVTQPAISRQIKSLEAKLGMTLLKRNTRQVRLTEAGEKCLPHMREMLSAYEKINRIAETHSQAVQGDLRIAYPNLFAIMLLGNVLKTIQTKYPALHIHLWQVPALQTASSLENAQADCAIGLKEIFKSNEMLAIKTIKAGHMVAVLPPDHPLADRKELVYKDMQSSTLIVHAMEREQMQDTGLAYDFSAHGIGEERLIQEARTEDIFADIAVGKGIGLMPDGLFCYSITPLVAIPIVDTLLENDVVIAWKKSDSRASIAALLVELKALEEQKS